MLCRNAGNGRLSFAMVPQSVEYCVLEKHTHISWAREPGGHGMGLHFHFVEQTCCCVVFVAKSRGRWEWRQPWQPNQESFTRGTMRHRWQALTCCWPVKGCTFPLWSSTSLTVLTQRLLNSVGYPYNTIDSFVYVFFISSHGSDMLPGL